MVQNGQQDFDDRDFAPEQLEEGGDTKTGTAVDRTRAIDRRVGTRERERKRGRGEKERGNQEKDRNVKRNIG